MNATDLLKELRPPIDDSTTDGATLERILHADPEPPPAARRRRYRRPLAPAGATAIAATAAIALAPSDRSGSTGLAGAVAALAQPDVLMHFEVTTMHLPSGATETAETWQTPDGRRARTIYANGVEVTYDQRRRVFETYVPARDEVLVETEPELFEEENDPFGSIAGSAPSNPVAAGDLAELLTRALSGEDPNVQHVGRTVVAGTDVDHIRLEVDTQVADAEPGTSPAELRRAPMKTVTVVRDVYVRHDNALPVRVVDDLEKLGNAQNTSSVSDFNDAQKLAFDASTEPSLKPGQHPGAERTVRGAFDDSAAERRP